MLIYIYIYMYVCMHMYTYSGIVDLNISIFQPNTQCVFFL